MRFLARLFTAEYHPKNRDSISHIVEGDMRFPITQEYANTGFEEGWLELVHYRIDIWGTEHCEYRHV